MRILVVDDDAVVLESCRRVLVSEGYPVEVVGSAQAAREALGRSAFDLLLFDIKMPDEDGFSLVCWVREHHPRLPCLLMSGYATRETISESRCCGACGFLAKPFTPDELVAKVQAAFDESESGQTKNEEESI